ncbi:uncharacterized protein LOC119836120 [Zerene cesonia]|uniref:uncharacterized protein LOC119836120 n=1 Tax=Zerene cesonia TaxID=33412 RepID=UPI0018E56C49|nr:uncharacterized protein LOC119836120 [Zerene cesonia]
MTVIAVDGVPPKLTMKLFIRKLSWVVKGHFEALGFEFKKNSPKICYLKLSPNLNAADVIRRINNYETPSGKFKLRAYVPSTVPNLGAKPVTLSNRLRRVMKIPLELTPEECFLKVHNEIIKEMVYKFTGLLNLSKKTNHKLMDNICLTVAERLRRVSNSSKIVNTPFKLSSAYRKAHPHFGDFQFILCTLHMLEDAQAQQRSQISEKELTVVYYNPDVINNVRHDNARETCNKYSERIIKKVTEHINSLKTDSHPDQTEEEKARVNVRKQLKKIAPYLALMVKEVTGAHLKPVKQSFYDVRIYGEPYYPSRDEVKVFLKKFGARSVHRDDAMFNLAMFKLTRQAYMNIMNEDGVTIGGCKLTIRGSDLPTYKIPESVLKQISISEPALEEGHVVAEENWEDW